MNHQHSDSPKLPVKQTGEAQGEGGFAGVPARPEYAETPSSVEELGRALLELVSDAEMSDERFEECFRMVASSPAHRRVFCRLQDMMTQEMEDRGIDAVIEAQDDGALTDSSTATDTPLVEMANN